MRNGLKADANRGSAVNSKWDKNIQLKDKQIKQQKRWTLWSMVMSVVSVKFMVLSYVNITRISGHNDFFTIAF